ncbi:MAG: hypothetical protein ACXVF8_23005, partial [Blastococcus sp.]
NTTNPDDWARISGKKGERIVYIRTLISGKGPDAGRVVGAAPRSRMRRENLPHAATAVLLYRTDGRLLVHRRADTKDIFGKYLVTELPLHPDDLAEHGGSREATLAAMVQGVVERIYTEGEENKFLEVTYAGGDKEVLYFKDFNSGAMIENIVARGKKMAIKDFLETGQKGLRMQHLLTACIDEFKENEDLPNTTNPDDWARISGKKGERIVYIRTLVSSAKGSETGKSIDTIANTGQYL